MTLVKNEKTDVQPTLEPKPTESIKPSNSKVVTATQSSVSSNDLASKPATGELVNAGSLIEQAIQRVNPTYPAYAKAAHVTGLVRVDLVIDEKGAVVSAQSTTGPSVLRQAAIDASKRWKFRPTMRDGRPVVATGFINFNFNSK